MKIAKPNRIEIFTERFLSEMRGYEFLPVGRGAKLIVRLLVIGGGFTGKNQIFREIFF
ncbi:hypothetical protein AAEJ74_13805 [Limnospira fusiformis PMC 851.14]|uniref:Uncharacterized protein n=1 Tax=Limnospira fusiformis PMC 851.14 TaxID=2219512 RepID=A0ABU9ELE6_LIMFS